MVEIALTGNIAAGKSTVAEVLSEAGLPVLRADDLARAAVLPGSSVLGEVRRTFGDEAIAESGRMNRDYMRRLVFSDPEARRKLERLLHPHIRRLRHEWTARRRAEGAAVVVVEIPLLFELGLEGEFDAVVLVHAPDAVREERLTRDRGLDPEDARAMMTAQNDSAEKTTKADRVLTNDGTLEELKEGARRLATDILTGRFP